MSHEIDSIPNFTCAICKITYKKVRTHQECMDEVEKIMPESINDKMASICDDCWHPFMKWFDKLTPEQKKKMRENC